MALAKARFGPDPVEPFTTDDHKAVANAAKRLAAGEATPDQQQRFMQALIQDICGTHHWYHGDQEKKDIALGKRFVGLQVIALIETPLGGEDG